MRTTTKPRHWSCDDVTEWLEAHGFDRYRLRFAQCGVDGKRLRAFVSDPAAMAAVRVTHPPDQLKIARAAAALFSIPPPGSPASVPSPSPSVARGRVSPAKIRPPLGRVKSPLSAPRSSSTGAGAGMGASVSGLGTPKLPVLPVVTVPVVPLPPSACRPQHAGARYFHTNQLAAARQAFVDALPRHGVSGAPATTTMPVDDAATALHGLGFVGGGVAAGLRVWATATGHSDGLDFAAFLSFLVAWSSDTAAGPVPFTLLHGVADGATGLTEHHLLRPCRLAFDAFSTVPGVEPSREPPIPTGSSVEVSRVLAAAGRPAPTVAGTVVGMAERCRDGVVQLLFAVARHDDAGGGGGDGDDAVLTAVGLDAMTVTHAPPPRGVPGTITASLPVIAKALGAVGISHAVAKKRHGGASARHLEYGKVGSGGEADPPAGPGLDPPTAGGAAAPASASADGAALAPPDAGDVDAQLLVAAGRGDLDGVRAAVGAGADLGAVAAGGETALRQAAAGGHGAVVLWLARCGAAVDGRASADGLTPAHAAAVGGHGGVLSYLVLVCGASVPAADVMTHVEVKEFVALCARPNVAERLEAFRRGRSLTLLTPGHHTVAFGHAADAKAFSARLALVRCLDVMTEPMETVGATGLLAAAATGDLAALQAEAGRGADVDAVDYKGNSALRLAACHGHGACVVWLVRHGVDVDATDPSGVAAAGLAAVNGQPAVLAYLALVARAHVGSNWPVAAATRELWGALLATRGVVAKWRRGVHVPGLTDADRHTVLQKHSASAAAAARRLTVLQHIMSLE